MTLSPLVASLAILAAALVALALVTDALASRRERAVEAAFPPMGQIVTVDGARVHALTLGTGPDVIVIHGASGNLRDLLPLMQALAPHYRVTAFDRPGLGWSDPIPGGTGLAAQALHLSQAAVQLGITGPIVLGQSYGGAAALAWALEAPLKPRALVLVSAPSLPWPGTLDPWYRLTNTAPGRALAIPLVAAFTPDTYVAATTAAIFAPNPVPAGYGGQIGAGLALRRSSLRTNTAQVNALRAELVAQSPRYPGLALPIELIHGDADTIVPLSIHSAPLSRLLPQARLTVLPGLGHMPHHAARDTVTAALTRADQRSQLR
jgi:pimeloyl-ACP methyl ester carboxylesterase